MAGGQHSRRAAIINVYAEYLNAGAVLALARWGPKGGTIPAGGARGPQYAAELSIYWCILQLN